MTTYDRILADVKAAMKGGDAARRDCLRGVVSDVKNRTVNEGRPVTEDAVQACLRKAAKSRREAIEQFEGAGREDLASKERAELGFLEAYLPKAMTPEETRAAVDAALKNLGLERTRKSTGAVMKALPAGADRKAAAAYLSEILN